MPTIPHTTARPLRPGPLSRQFAVLAFSLSAALAVPTTTLAQSFGTPQTIAGFGNSLSIAVGDVNGDGKVDVVGGSLGGTDFTVALGDGTGGFGTPVKFFSGPDPRTVALGDFNGDGKLDVISGHFNGWNGNTCSINLGDGTGGFGAPTVYALPASPVALPVFQVATGDFNGDGKLDVVVIAGDQPYTPMVAVWLNGGLDANGKVILTPSFTRTFPAQYGSRGATWVSVADLDGDGKKDLAISGQINNSADKPIHLLYGNGDGTFGANVDMTVALDAAGNPLSTANLGITAADLNGDGRPDLIASSANYAPGGGSVTVFLNQGSRTFAAPVTYPTFRGALPASVGDLNNDGFPDLVVGCQNDGVTSYFLNNGAGGFGTVNAFGLGTPGNTALADLNHSGNGTLDLIVATQDAGTKVVLNGTPLPQLSFPAPSSNQSWAGTKLEFGDLNGDGRLDIVTTKSPSGAFTVAYNNGNGTFTESTIVGNSVSKAIIVDVNEDGRPDIVTLGLGPFGNGINVYINTGSGFVAQYGYPIFQGQSTSYFPANYNASTITAGKTRGANGKIDLVVSSYLPNPILVFRGNGDGSFQPNPVQVPNPTAVTYGSTVLKLADLDGDGYADLVAMGGEFTYFCKVWRNDGAGDFPAAASFTAPMSSSHDHVGDLTLADMNGDGRLDVVVTAADDNQNWLGFVRWYENTGGALTNFPVHVAFTGKGTRADTNGGFGTDWFSRFTAADLDGDGKVDFVATAFNGVPAILHNNGDGTLTAVSEVPRSSPAIPYAYVDYVFLADLTGTGVPTLLGGKGNNNAGIVYGPLQGAPAPTVLAPVVSNGGITRGYGEPLTFTIVATNSPTSYGATNLPASLSLNPATGVISGNAPMVLGDYSATVSATNAGGTGTGNFAVRVIDYTPPVITAPSTLTVEATSAAGAVVTFTASASDVISGAVPVTATPASGSTIGLGISTINLSATDGSNNTATKQILVTVRDTTRPVLTLPAPITVEATGPGGAIVNFAASAADLVSGNLPVVLTPLSGSTFAVGTTSVSAAATDGANNTATGTFTVTVTDTTAPVITVPANIVVEATSAAGAAVTYSASATDLVSGAVAVTASKASGSTFALGTTTVTLTATDAANNTATATFTVTVRDTTKPVLTLPANLTLEATSAAGAVGNFVASATDAADPAPAISYGKTPGSVFPFGTTTVNITATDASGNVASGSFAVTVRDRTGPAITAPANVVVEATGAAGAAVTFTASAFDLVDGAVSVTATAASGSTFALGTTTVNLTATDAHGNTTAAAFTVTVQDTIAPTLNLPANQVLEATGPAGAIATFAATASDAVGVTSLTASAASGSTFPLGMTTVTVTARDAAGHVTTGSFTITVRDTTAPTIRVIKLPNTVVTGDLELNAEHPDGAFVQLAFSANDLVSGAVGVGLNRAPAGVFPIGMTTITATATDAAGNVATRTVTITVLGAAQQIVKLIAMVEAIPGLDPKEASKLTDRLDKALDFLTKNNRGGAAGQINAFTAQAAAAGGGKNPGLTPAQLQTLFSAARNILRVL